MVAEGFREVVEATEEATDDDGEGALVGRTLKAAARLTTRSPRRVRLRAQPQIQRGSLEKSWNNWLAIARRKSIPCALLAWSFAERVVMYRRR